MSDTASVPTLSLVVTGTDDPVERIRRQKNAAETAAILNILDENVMTEITNTQMLLIRQQEKSAVIATVLNVLWFGLGSLYARQWSDAFFGIVVLFPVLAILCIAFPPAIIFVLAVAIISGIGAVKKYNLELIKKALK